METTKERNLDVLETVEHGISMLNQAAEDVEAAKRNLQGAGAEVKAQIHDSISRHIEAMRNREMWLLGQAEMIEHIKEEGLSQQLSEIHQAIGALQSITSMLEGGPDVDFLEAYVQERIAEVQKLGLVAEESSHLKFSGQNFELLQMIRKFGVLDSGSSQVEKQVCMLFQGLHLTGNDSGLSSHTFHCPTGTTQDWLLKTSLCDSNKKIQFQHPLGELSLNDWLCQASQSTPWKNLQENQWLSGCHEESEEKSMAGLSWNHSTGMEEWLLTSAGQKIHSSDLFGYYEVVKMSDNNQWLREAHGPRTACELNTSRIGETYARIAASGPEQWLAKNTATPQPLTTSLIGDMYAKIAASMPECWLVGKSPLQAQNMLLPEETKSKECIESCNCLEGECEAESVELSETSSNFSDWLSVKKEDEDEATEAEFTIKPVDVEDVADWLLKSWSKGKESLSEGSSSGVGKYSEHLSNTPVAQWLVQGSTLPKFDILSADDTGAKNYAQKLSGDSVQMWLCKSQNGLEPEVDLVERVSSGVGEYLQALSGDNNQWLIQEPADSNVCQWLARSGTESCDGCPKMHSKGLFGVFEKVASHSSENWLTSNKE